MGKRVLVVDDEKLIVKGIRFSLEQDDMEVDCAYDGEEALKLVSENSYDMVLLDVMLPKMDGFQVCQQIREFSDVPVIMLTAKGDDMDKILGLDYGADDYITKPFQPLEVVARVRSQLRRYMQLGAGSMKCSRYVLGGIELDDSAKTVNVDGAAVSLTPTEFAILKLLISNQGKVYSPREIYRAIWSENPVASENTIAVHVRHIREKIEINPKEPRYLKVVWGVGYKIEKL